MQQCADWGAVRAVPLQTLVARGCPCPCRRRRDACCRAKPAASTYYDHYLRNRREWGGEILGPAAAPALLARAQQEQEQEEWEEEEEAAPQQQQQQQQQKQQQQQQGRRERQRRQGREPGGRAQPSSSGQLGTPEQADGTPRGLVLLAPPPGAVPPASALTPRGFAQLVDSCMLSTSPGPLRAPAPASADAAASPAPPPVQQQQQQQQQQRQRSAWQFPDFVPPELAQRGLLQELKPRPGVTLEPPAFEPAEPLVPLPDLPWSFSPLQQQRQQQQQQQQQWQGAAAPHGRRRARQLHVFWDLGSCHPGGLDPRVVAAQLRRTLGHYGEVQGVYAYGLKKMLSWIPEAFMLQYAPERLPSRSRRLTGSAAAAAAAAAEAEREAELQGALRAAACRRLDVDGALGPLRCPVCGKLRGSYHQLQLHMVQRHKQPAPPLARLVPAGALERLLQGGPGGGGGPRPAQRPAADAWAPFDPLAARNSGTRTLGRVTAYHNAAGDLFAPRDGQQPSLKYVLLREGVEVRVVMNQRRAIDEALAAGLQALQRRLLARDAASAQLCEDVVVVVSDRGAHAGAVAALRRSGVGVVAVCRRIRQYSGAHATLRWQWAVAGRYEGPGGSSGGGGVRAAEDDGGGAAAAADSSGGSGAGAAHERGGRL